MAGRALFRRRFAGCNVLRGLLLDRFFKAKQSRAPLPAEMQETLVDDDAGNPGAETRLFPERVQLLEGTAVGRLHGILSVRLIAEYRPRDPERCSVVTPDQLRHGFLVALFALFDQFLVR